MATRFRDGKATVTLEGDLERLALEAVDRALPNVRKLIETDVKDILATARGEWPVKTGRSQAGLVMVTEITENALLIKIENPVPYAIWVRPRAWYGVTTAWQRLVRSPMRVASRGLARRVGHIITAHLSRNR